MCYFCVAPPQIIFHPLDKIIRINNDSTSVAFTCVANGASSYFWLRDIGSIPSNVVETKTNTSILTLHNILPSYSARYQCVAENKHGRTYSNYAMLTIEGTYVLAE